VNADSRGIMPSVARLSTCGQRNDATDVIQRGLLSTPGVW